MRNINTWLLFVFLLHLATTGGKESGSEEVVEEEVVMEEMVEEDERISRLDSDEVEERERRGLYGGSEKEGLCPKQCLCLSEIQVLCNTGNITKFPRELPNVTQDISITNQNIKMIPKYAFKGMKHLKKITLDRNKIVEIQPFAFKGLNNIDEISLRWNPIETIAGFAFAGIRNVSQIYLGYNKIKILSGYAFAGSENIAMLVINDNPIRTIDSFAFAGLKNVKFLLVSSSVRHLHTDAFNGLETVEHLKLDFLNLLKLVSYTFRGLFNCRKLTIDNSDLGTIQPKAMSGMLGVEELNIINSKIDKIHENVISEESEVKTVRLEGNHLLAIPDDFDYMTLIVPDMEQLVSTKNHVPCSCSLLSVLLSLLGDHKANKLFSQNFCVSPLEFNGLTMAEMLLRCETLDHLQPSPSVTTLRPARPRERKREKPMRDHEGGGTESLASSQVVTLSTATIIITSLANIWK